MFILHLNGVSKCRSKNAVIYNTKVSQTLAIPISSKETVILFEHLGFGIENQQSVMFQSSCLGKPRKKEISSAVVGWVSARRPGSTLSQGEPSFPSLRITLRCSCSFLLSSIPRRAFLGLITTKLKHTFVIPSKNWVQILALPLSSVVLLGKSVHLSGSWFPPISKNKANNHLKGQVQRCNQTRYVKRPDSIIFFSIQMLGYRRRGKTLKLLFFCIYYIFLISEQSAIQYNLPRWLLCSKAYCKSKICFRSLLRKITIPNI